MVLVAVLWMMVLLSMLAAALVVMSRSDARNAWFDLAQFQDDETVQAAINLAIAALTDPSQHWPTDGTPRTIKFGDAPVEVAITSEAGKIDLNNANPDLLRGLLTAVGEGPGAADEITNDIVIHRESGGFTNLSELLQLPEISSDLFNRLAPSLTLYSGSNSVDSSTASLDVLLAIPGNTSADAEAEMARRASPGASIDTPSRPVMAGQAFTVIGKMTSPGRAGVLKSEVLRLTGSSSKPIFILLVFRNTPQNSGSGKWK